jgi:hypothetical protein
MICRCESSYIYINQSVLQDSICLKLKAKGLSRDFQLTNEHVLKPFTVPGNLHLPWALTPPIADLDEATFCRKEWGPNGENSEEFFMGGGLTYDMDMLEKMMGTTS